MAKGRARQLRQHAVHQAGLVWGMFQGMQPQQISQFVELGTIDEAAPERIPYDPGILQDLQKRAQ